MSYFSLMNRASIIHLQYFRWNCFFFIVRVHKPILIFLTFTADANAVIVQHFSMEYALGQTPRRHGIGVIMEILGYPIFRNSNPRAVMIQHLDNPGFSFTLVLALHSARP